MTGRAQMAGEALALLLCLAVDAGAAARGQDRSPSPGLPSQKGTQTMHAKGDFDVKLVPQAPEDKTEGSTLGRMSIDKQYHGDLEGTSKGEMLSAMTGVKGSAGYVALERVTGKLQERSGTFVLQHDGMMNRGDARLTITVVPDSGTGQLAGLAGTMTIQITEGKDFYELQYTLPEPSGAK
jgi:uncharacterized protein DUF3224